jgi:hypothetical protein
MKRSAVTGLGILLLAGCQTQILSEEPKAGTLKTGQRVYVDNGSCSQGQVLEVVGSVPGVPRKKQCVDTPSS